MKEYLKQYIDKKCKECGAPFCGNSVKLYCSSQCKNTASKNRDREKYHSLKHKKRQEILSRGYFINPTKKQKEIRRCKICGDKLTGERLIYCSRDCKEINRKRTYEENKKPYLEVSNCEICHMKFRKKNPNHKICSEKCRKLKQEKIKNLKWFEENNENVNNSLKLRFEIMKRDNFTCQYCGRNVKEDKIKIHADHIIPRSKGGMDLPNNLVTSCEECNLGKRDIELNEVILNEK